MIQNVAIDEHRCDVFVLARHSGDTIETGWTFRVALPTQLVAGKRTAKQLDAAKVGEVDGSELANAVVQRFAARHVQGTER